MTRMILRVLARSPQLDPMFQRRVQNYLRTPNPEESVRAFLTRLQEDLVPGTPIARLITLQLAIPHRGPEMAYIPHEDTVTALYDALPGILFNSVINNWGYTLKGPVGPYALEVASFNQKLTVRMDFLHETKRIPIYTKESKTLPEFEQSIQEVKQLLLRDAQRLLHICGMD